MEIKFHGQSCFELSDGETTVLVDPFLAPNNPAVMDTLGYILVERGDTKRGLPYLEKAAAAAK